MKDIIGKKILIVNYGWNKKIIVEIIVEGNISIKADHDCSYDEIGEAYMYVDQENDKRKFLRRFE